MSILHNFNFKRAAVERCAHDEDAAACLVKFHPSEPAVASCQTLPHNLVADSDRVLNSTGPHLLAENIPMLLLQQFRREHSLVLCVWRHLPERTGEPGKT